MTRGYSKTAFIGTGAPLWHLRESIPRSSWIVSGVYTLLGTNEIEQIKGASEFRKQVAGRYAVLRSWAGDQEIPPTACAGTYLCARKEVSAAIRACERNLCFPIADRVVKTFVDASWPKVLEQ